MTDKPCRTFREVLEEAQRRQIERRSKLPLPTVSWDEAIRLAKDRICAAGLPDGSTVEQSIEEITARARAAQPVPVQPERRFCACGQEVRVQAGREWIRECGDCRSMEHQYFYPRHKGDLEGGRDVVTAKTLDARIAAAQKPDADPTQAWGAGATPGYEWEGT